MVDISNIISDEHVEQLRNVGLRARIRTKSDDWFLKKEHEFTLLNDRGQYYARFVISQFPACCGLLIISSVTYYGEGYELDEKKVASIVKDMLITIYHKLHDHRHKILYVKSEQEGTLGAKFMKLLGAKKHGSPFISVRTAHKLQVLELNLATKEEEQDAIEDYEAEYARADVYA